MSSESVASEFAQSVSHPPSSFENRPCLLRGSEAESSARTTRATTQDVSLVPPSDVQSVWCLSLSVLPASPIDNVWAIMIVWRLAGKIIRTVLCCVQQLCTMIRTHVWTVLKFACWFKFRFRFCVIEQSRWKLQGIFTSPYWWPDYNFEGQRSRSQQAASVVKVLTLRLGHQCLSSGCSFVLWAWFLCQHFSIVTPVSFLSRPV